MKKYLIRISVAVICCLLSIGLTNLLNSFGPSLETMLAGPVEALDVIEFPLNDPFASDEEEIRYLYDQYGPAKTMRDWAFFERLTTDDYTLSWRGLRITKGQDIDMMLGAPDGDVSHRSVEYVKVFGDVAVVQGHTEIRDKSGSVYSWKFLDTWVKQVGVWRMENTRLID
jgi:uncharacterized protein DUF4440